VKANKHIHILGIAGHAMRGIAYAVKQLDYTVTGTDEGATKPAVDWLKERGITCWDKPDPAHLDGVSSYPQLIEQFMKGAHRIVVTGTHGKTTTTTLIAWILESAGLKPDYLIGIKPNNFDTSVRLAHGKVAVLEGDEYRSSQQDNRSKFYYYNPNVAIITSIEHDHPDLFPDLESVTARFKDLVKMIPKDGRLIYCRESLEIQDILSHSKAPAESYGAGGDWEPLAVDYNAHGIVFDLMHHDKKLGRLSVPIYGAHNVLNATAAAAVALGQGVTFEQLQAACDSFKGASRRFERVSEPGAEITVIDDYAHHPTEAATPIDAVRKHFSGRVIAVFRPHTYSRTLGLLKEYQSAFDGADVAYITEIEGARESHLESQVSGADIASGEHVIYEPDRAKLVEAVVNEARPGDVVLCMTVNGYENLAQELAEKLNS
jgi:UDP-N-acetylmuramate: L-alanyl-gamma-D-glutamyl-meso-diaminopimelate ligase